MRVLVVSQFFSPENFYINQVVSTLVNKGIEVEVLTGKPNYPEGFFYLGYHAWGFQIEEILGCKVYRIPIVARYSGSTFWLALNYLSFVLSGLLLAPWLVRFQKYDAIFVYGVSPILQALPALFIGWLKSAPVVLWVQDLWPESLAATGYIRNKWILAWVRQLVRFIYHHSDLLLVQSKGFEVPVGALAPGKRVVYFPNSVESIFIDPPNIPLPAINALDKGFPIIFAGNLGKGQAVEVLVELAALLKSYDDINLIVLGKGSRWDWMMEQVTARNLTNLHLPGRYPIDTMPGLMKKAEALLVTLADEPIFAATVPNKIQAYMAAGRPILACLNGEGARIVQDSGAGITIAAENAPALAAAVIKLYGMSAQDRADMGARGPLYFKEHFDHNKLIDGLIRHLSALSRIED